MNAALDMHPRATPLHQQLRDAMAPHLGRELAHERAAALLSVLEHVTDYDDVEDCIRVARQDRGEPGPLPTTLACAQATVAACGVLRMWADAPVMLEVV